MLRVMRDNGTVEPPAVLHVLSPYPADHSAVTDCPKLLGSGFECRKGIIGDRPARLERLRALPQVVFQIVLVVSTTSMVPVCTDSVR